MSNLCLTLLRSQTGKSFLLARVLPALIAEDELFGVGCKAEARLFLLSTDEFDRENGVTGFLRSLLDELLRQSDALVVAKVQRVQQFADVVTCLDAFVDSLPHNVPHFILVDEVQNFFLLTKPDGTLDGSGIDRMRRRVFFLSMCSPLSHLLLWQNIQGAGRQQPNTLHVGAHGQQHGDVLGKPGAGPGERLFDPHAPARRAPANARGRRGA